MKQTILNRLFATHLSDSAKGTDVSIQPIFQKKRPPVMLNHNPSLRFFADCVILNML